MRLRDYTPQGYNARHILILIVPMLIFVVSMTLYFFSNHVSDVNQKLSRGVARELVFALSEHQRSPEDWIRIQDGYRRSGLMDLSFQEGGATLEPPDGRDCCHWLAHELDNQFSLPFAFAYKPDGLLTLRMLTEDGLLEAVIERKRVEIITAHIFIVWTVLFSVVLLATSYAFLRNQVRSITRLAEAADAFGRGEDAPHFRPSGAREVRQAARSIIRMRNRIRRFADQRAAMLAGVSHDLRTPITRLKLELAMLPKAIDLSAAKEDIAEMEQMLEGYLAFAKGAESESPVEIDVSRIAQEAVSHLSETVDLDVHAGTSVFLRARPLNLKRAISNLANNAADHAKRVRVSVWRDAEFAHVAVEDDGPGIASDKIEDAFRPFSRLDASRNQNVSGVGLGLTIARDTARSHGGDIELSRSSDMGGLKALISLPLDQSIQQELPD